MEIVAASDYDRINRCESRSGEKPRFRDGNYLDANFGNASYDYGNQATAGIQQNSSNALQYSCNTASLSDELTLMYYRQ